MKKRTFNVLNFFAFNILFFALYLNFIHKDINTLPAVSASSAIAPKSVASNGLKATHTTHRHKEKSAQN